MQTVGISKPDGLIVGDFPLEAVEVQVQGPAEFRRGDVVGLVDNQNLVLADSSLKNGGQNPVGIMCRDINPAQGETAVTTMYVKGAFNLRNLRFGGSDTFENHKRRMTEIGLIVRETRV